MLRILLFFPASSLVGIDRICRLFTLNLFCETMKTDILVNSSHTRNLHKSYHRLWFWIFNKIELLVSNIILLAMFASFCMIIWNIPVLVGTVLGFLIPKKDIWNLPRCSVCVKHLVEFKISKFMVSGIFFFRYAGKSTKISTPMWRTGAATGPTAACAPSAAKSGPATRPSGGYRYPGSWYRNKNTACFLWSSPDKMNEKQSFSHQSGYNQNHLWNSNSFLHCWVPLLLFFSTGTGQNLEAQLPF